MPVEATQVWSCVIATSLFTGLLMASFSGKRSLACLRIRWGLAFSSRMLLLSVSLSVRTQTVVMWFTLGSSTTNSTVMLHGIIGTSREPRIGHLEFLGQILKPVTLHAYTFIKVLNMIFFLWQLTSQILHLLDSWDFICISISVTLLWWVDIS